MGRVANLGRTSLLALGAAALLWATPAGPAHGQTAAPVWPDSTWRAATPTKVGMIKTTMNRGVNYAKGFGGSGMVVRNGYRVAYWGDQALRYQLYSSTKSFGSIVLGLAVGDGRLGLGTQARSVLPEIGLPPDSNAATGWPPLITVEQLATHTAGFDKEGGFLPLLFRPGTRWAYSDGGANWLADVVTAAYRQDLYAVLNTRVLGPLQISASDLTWRQNMYRPRTLLGVTRREFGSGISANVGAMARVGLMMARGGRWKDRQILPASYVGQAGRTPASVKGLPLNDPTLYPGATRHYGLLWWNNADGAIGGLPTDAFWSWGLTDTVILAVPSLDLVVARAGPRMEQGWGDLDALRPFLGPIGSSVRRNNAPPAVDVGPDLAATTAQPLRLAAVFADNGLPGAGYAYRWSAVSGPGAVTFGTPVDDATSATFAAAGVYVVRLTIGDGALAGQDELTVTVADPATPPRRASRRSPVAEGGGAG